MFANDQDCHNVAMVQVERALRQHICNPR
jgi:hypothetical protein